jgi:hypothetical protein
MGSMESPGGIPFLISRMGSIIVGGSNGAYKR